MLWKPIFSILVEKHESYNREEGNEEENVLWTKRRYCEK